MTEITSKNIRFNSEIQTIEKVNPLFSSATIRVLYTGFNRNGSYFSKDSVLKSIDSIYNIPLVGEYIEHADNFGDHGTTLEIKGNEIKMVRSTRPYGLIPESANIYWEDVTEADGTVNEYLVVDGAYLWSGRYEELNTLLEQPFNQSMEIEVINGNFAVIEGKETFNVDEFLFSALCILGIDKDGEGEVEPAFESANITTYSLDKDDFKKQFNQMTTELKFSLEKEGGNTNMSKKNENATTEAEETIISDYEKNEVDTNIDSDITDDSTDASYQSDDTKADKTLEDSESTVDDSQAEFEDGTDNGDTEPASDEPNEEEVVDPDIEEDEVAEDEEEPAKTEDSDDDTSTTAKPKKEEAFVLTSNQLTDELYKKLGEDSYVDTWGDERRKYWYVDHTDDSVIYEDTEDNYQLLRAPYTLIGDSVEIQFSESIKVKVEYVPFEDGSGAFSLNTERFKKLASQTADAVKEAESVLEENYQTLSTDYEILKGQLEELQAYKRSNEETGIKAKFAGKLSDEEFSTVFSDMKDDSLESIEEKLFALVGKKNFAMQQATETKTTSVKINSKKNEESNPFKALEQYLK